MYGGGEGLAEDALAPEPEPEPEPADAPATDE
jgi:hypothetical protein